jgi:hypothetical protein
MSSRNDLSDHLVVLQLNADLRSAQVDLLSAQCATDRLRLRFSTDDLARHSQRDLLRKAAGSASALHEFYSTIEKAVVAVESGATPHDPTDEPAQ